MAIPKEILAVKRPSSTVVKQRGNRFVVMFKYLAKYKKVRIREGGSWQDVTMLKYIEEMVAKRDV